MNKAEQFWDKQASKYDQVEGEFEPSYKDIMAKTKAYLKSTDHVLDFGCATGVKTLEFAKGVNHINGIDLSTEMIKIANTKKMEAGVENITFSSGTIFGDDLESASFDKIIAFGVIHLLEESEKSLQRIHELLKPGGLLIATTPCFKEKMTFKTRLQFSIVFLLKRLGMFPLHLNKFSATDIENLIKDQYFNIVQTETLFHGMTVSFIVAKKN